MKIYLYFLLAFALQMTRQCGAESEPVRECLKTSDPMGAEYNGIVSQTKTGRECQSWNTDIYHKRHEKPIDLDNNYCRNPVPDDKTSVKPWCYVVDTSNPEVRWEYCDIPDCGNVDCKLNQCNHKCVSTVGRDFCECPEDHEMQPDLITCTPRLGVADCKVDFQPIGGSCVKLLDNAVSYYDAMKACESVGARIATVKNAGIRMLYKKYFLTKGEDLWIGLNELAVEGNWINSDGTAFTFQEGWERDQPGPGDCGLLRSEDGYFAASKCGRSHKAICEIPRSKGFVIFRDTWPNGALGTLYFPYDVDRVKLTFPRGIRNINSWYSSINSDRSSSNTAIIHQTDVERASGAGQGEFTMDMGTRFPDYEVDVEAV